jgi:PEP-CTERM motif
MVSFRSIVPIVLGILFLSCLIFPESARADDIIVTSGHVNVTSNIRDLLDFNFSGSGLSASGFDLHAVPVQYSSPCLSSPALCQPGDLIFPNSLVVLTSEFGSGSSVTFNGSTVLVSWASHDSVLAFSGPGTEIPTSNESTLTITSPFEMTGTINVHPLSDPSTVIFSTTISGRGLATLTLQRPAGNPEGYALTAANYNFEPATVPEPATLVLLGTGVVGGILGRRRRIR